MAYTAIDLPGLFSYAISSSPWLFGFDRPTSWIPIFNARIPRINEDRCRVDGDRRILRINQARCRVNGDRPPIETAAPFPSWLAGVLSVFPDPSVDARTSVVPDLDAEKKDDGVEPERSVLDEVLLEYMRNADEVVRTTPVSVQVPEGYAVLIRRRNSKAVLEEGTHLINPFLEKVESKFRICYDLSQFDIGQFELTGKIKISLDSYDNKNEIQQLFERAIRELVEVLRNELNNKYVDGLIVRKTTNNALQALINNQAKYYHVQLNLLLITPVSLSENQDRLKLLVDREKCRNEKTRKKSRYEIVVAILAASLLRGVVSKDWQRILLTGISLVLAATAAF